MFAFERNRITQRMVDVPGTDHKLPVTVIAGAEEGKTVLVSAGVHCREYVGTEALIRLTGELDPSVIRGTVYMIPLINYTGFFAHANDEIPEDGRNLNHSLPGDPKGTVTDILADYICREILADVDYVIDLHSGGSYEDLTPHAYFSKVADADVMKASIELSAYVDMPYTVGMTSRDSLVSWSAVQGKPSVLIERGRYSIWNEEQVIKAQADVQNMLRFLGVLEDGTEPVRHWQKVFMNAVYDEAPVSGCWYPLQKPGEFIRKGELIGRIGDLFGNTLREIYALEDGVILYQTSSLALTEGEAMTAYGVLEGQD